MRTVTTLVFSRGGKGRSPRACSGDFGRGVGASRWTLTTQVMRFSLSCCRCVEIIAKEGRSLKELYLVSCKITDHGRTLPPPHTPGCSKDFINVLLGIIICFGETFHGKTLVCVVLRSSNHFSTDADVCSSNCSIVYACVAIMKRDIHFSVFLISFSKLKYFSTQ